MNSCNVYRPWNKISLWGFVKNKPLKTEGKSVCPIHIFHPDIIFPNVLCRKKTPLIADLNGYKTNPMPYSKPLFLYDSSDCLSSKVLELLSPARLEIPHELRVNARRAWSVVFRISMVTTCLIASEFTVSHSQLSRTPSSRVTPQHIWTHPFHSFPVREELQISQADIQPTRQTLAFHSRTSQDTR